MDHDLKPTEARQAEGRRSSRRALLWGLPLAVLALVIVWIIWAQSTGV